MNSERMTTEGFGLESSGSETDIYYYRAKYYDAKASWDGKVSYFAARRGAMPSNALLELEITSLAPSVSRISAKSSM